MILRKAFVAIPDMEALPQKLQHLLDLLHGGIGPEILSPVIAALPHRHDTGILLIHGYLNIRIVLVILQQRIVPRLIFLDQVGLQDQCLQLRIHHDIFKAFDQTDHLLNLCRFLIGLLKILLHPIPENLRLSHIDHLIPGSVHQINSRHSRELLKFLLNLKTAVTHCSVASAANSSLSFTALPSEKPSSHSDWPHSRSAIPHRRCHRPPGSAPAAPRHHTPGAAPDSLR